MSARAYILGWLNYANTGDEACYYAVRSFLDPSINLVHIPDARALDDMELPDVMILGGGTTLNLDLNVRMLALHKMLTKGIPCMTWGSGVFVHPDPSKQEPMSPHVLHCLKIMPMVTVRGPLSKRRLEEQGFFEAMVIGDPAFLLEPTPDSPLEDHNRRIAINVGNVTKLLYGNEEKFLNQMASLVKSLESYQIFYVPLWGGYDEPFLEELRGNTGIGTVLPWEPSFYSLMKFFRTCRVVIGEKLHASVLAAAAGVPFISLAYQEKCLDFAESLNLGDYAIRTDDPDLAVKVYEKVKNIKNEKDRIIQSIREHKMKYRNLHVCVADMVKKICK